MDEDVLQDRNFILQFRRRTWIATRSERTQMGHTPRSCVASDVSSVWSSIPGHSVLTAMDGLLKEIDKLEKLTSNSSNINKSKSPSINDSLDSLLQTLREQKARIERGASCPEAQFQDLSKTIEQRKKEIDERQKLVYNSLARYGKALDKVCNKAARGLELNEI